MNTISEQDLLVAEFLKSINIDYSVKWIGIAGNNSNFKDSDQWLITFKKTGKFSESFDFYTGSGHRIINSGLFLSPANKKYNDSLKAVTGLHSAIMKASTKAFHKLRTPTIMRIITGLLSYDLSDPKY